MTTQSPDSPANAEGTGPAAPAAAAPTETEKPTLTDRLLDGLADGIKNRKQPGSWFGKIGHCWRRTGALVVWSYVLGLLVVLTALHFWGDAHWLTSSLLYLPQQGWLLPVPFVGMVALVSYRRGLLLLAGCVVLVLWPYMDYNTHAGSQHGEGLTVMSNNRGETSGHSIQSYLDLHDPDIVCFQDAPGVDWEYSQRFPEKFRESNAGGFLMSRYPIVEESTRSYGTGEWATTAGRFVVDYDGRQIAIWQVHFPSPRDMLLSLQGRGFLYELFGLRKMKYGDDYRGYPKFLAQRTEMTDAFVADLRQERLPFIVAGDFNMPDRGVLYRRYSAFMTDSFEAGGTGYGYSFPGTTRQAISGFGPWLRLDYIWHSPHWRTEYAETEPDRKSQHRAVMTRLTLREP